MAPTTHLPGHMDSVRQKCRPKHQLVILKCYPRLPKNSAADVKPNSSELSYLLYYASTRNSKLQKVGAFLEKKTAADVSNAQSARVLVTLQILTALVEHKVIGHANGFALIGPSVLRILRDIITNSNDISLIEATIETWCVFCDRQDGASVAADSDYRELFTHVVSLYSNLAKNGPKKLGKSADAVPTNNAIRLRKAGLAALECNFTATDLPSWWNGQFDKIIPAVASNLYSRDPDYLDDLKSLNEKENEETSRTQNGGRPSATHGRTISNYHDAVSEPDPRAAEGTTQEADILDEQEVGKLALDCLQSIFQSQNRAQIRGGALAFMYYISEVDGATARSSGDNPADSPVTAWATKLFRLMTSWAPVQERFIFIVTAVETLVKASLEPSNLRVHLLYTNLIDDVLRSDLNLVGLSIMDVLLSLSKHVQRTTALDQTSANGHAAHGEISQNLLLTRLKDCIADLATHVYYSDQITDMISAILYRLKPTPTTSHEPPHPTTASTQATESKSSGTDNSSSNLSRLNTRERLHGCFMTDAQRQLALEAIKDILEVASRPEFPSTGNNHVTNRNAVPVTTWNGTQWLQHDPAPAVRRAYREAVTAWAEYESKEKDASILDFDAEDCLAVLLDREHKASVALRGSFSSSSPSHRQLLVAPEGRRLSRVRTWSSINESGTHKSHVRVEHLKDILEGKTQLAIRVGGRHASAGTGGANGIANGRAEPVDVNSLLAGISFGETRHSTLNPPY